MTINGLVNSCIMRGTTQFGAMIQSSSYKLQGILKSYRTQTKTFAIFS